MGLFASTNLGTGTVTAEVSFGSNTKSDTASVTVVAQNVTIVLDKATITPKSANAKVGDKVKFSGMAYDQFGNELAKGVAYTWSVTGSVGSIDGIGTFTATGLGTGSVVLTATFEGTSKSDVAQVTVTQGGGQPLIKVVIDPLDVAMSVGSTQRFTAKVYDKDGNLIQQGVNLTWTVTGVIGTIDANGLFTAKTEGKGSVNVTVQYGGLSATNGTNVTVKPGAQPGDNGGISGTNGLIILGVAAAAVTGCVLAALWFRRRRNRKVADPADADPPVHKDKKG
jgi:hypothetical protein